MAKNASIFDLVGQARPKRKARKKVAKKAGKKAKKKWGTLEEWYRRLCMVCLILRFGYYCRSKSLFADEEYDALEKLILKIEDGNRALIHPNSPTSTAGSDVEESYPQSVRWCWETHEEDGTFDTLVKAFKVIVEETQAKFGIEGIRQKS